MVPYLMSCTNNDVVRKADLCLGLLLPKASSAQDFCSFISNKTATYEYAQLARSLVSRSNTRVSRCRRT